MMNPWQKVAHALTYVSGLNVYEWKRSVENWILSIPAPSAPNKTVYEDFEEEFIKSWTDTNESYHAAAALNKLRMKDKNVDKYITIFAKLARKALYHEDDPAVLEKFKSGLPLELLECYAQALGVVDVGSLLVELSVEVRVRSGRPSCRASQGQNHGVWRGCKDSGKSGNRPEDQGVHK